MLSMCVPVLQDKLIREHFLAQTPTAVLHFVDDEGMTLVLDVPDLSLLDESKTVRDYYIATCILVLLFSS